ncbi:MAG: carboxypeptidase-like regulatory domain-containing protein [Bacteroidota bacterium]
MRTKRSILVFCLIIIYSAISCGQKINTLSGKVKDFQNQHPISNAYVYTNSGNTAITDSLGVFNLTHLNQDIAYVVVSHVGYKNDTIVFSQVEPDQPMEVNLNILATYLDEVVVQDVNDPALLLIRKVIENLPKNYKREGCSSHDVLLREALQLKGNDSIPLYLVEATLKDYVNVEGKKLKYEVDLLRTRNYIHPNYGRYTKVELTGTAFINKKYNPVLTLSGPLDRSHNEKRYTFSIIDTSYVSNGKYIKLQFKHNKNTEFQGYLIVNSDDFSFSEYHLSQSKKNPFLLDIDTYKKKTLELHVTYKKTGMYYDIDEIKAKQEYFPFKGDTLLSEGHYLNLKDRFCQENHQISIPLKENEVLLDRLDHKKAPEWTPSSILEMRKFDYLFKHKTISGKQRAEVKQRKSFKSRLRLSYQTPLWISNVNHFNINFQHPVVFFNDSINNDRSVNISIATIISYEINHFFLIELGGFDSLKKNRFSSTFLNLLYEWKLGKEATSFLSFGARFNYFKQRVFLQSMTEGEKFDVKGKKFDSGEFETYFEQRSFTIAPILSYLQRISHSTYLEFGCYFPINTIVKNGVFINEKDSFFRRKRAFTNENVLVISDEETVIKNTLNVFFGIKWLLK